METKCSILDRPCWLHDPHPDALAFCRQLPELAGLVAVPSSVFYDDPVRGAGLVRWAFCKSDAVLDEAIERLDRLRSS